MKIFLYFTGWFEAAHRFAKEFGRYGDVVLFGTDKGHPKISPYPKDINFVDYSRELFNEQKDYMNFLSSFDIYIGLDHGAVGILSEIKKVFNKKVGCYIIDFPEHTFVKNKDYSEVISKGAIEYASICKNMDFLIFTNKSCQDSINKFAPDVKKILINSYPVIFNEHQDIERKDFILYSGATNPTKGVHYLISALGLIPNAPELLLVSYTGDDLENFAKYLNVKYKRIGPIQHEEKMKFYRECRFLVSPPDNNYIASLSVLEGLSVGRSSLVFDYEEGRRIYRNFVKYVEPLNIRQLADDIQDWIDNPEKPDILAKDAPKFIREECSHSTWVDTLMSSL